jgi:hypothetical protein
MKADLAHTAAAAACSGARATTTARAAYRAKVTLSTLGKCGEARKQFLAGSLAAGAKSRFVALAKGAPQLEFAAAFGTEVFVNWHCSLLYLFYPVGRGESMWPHNPAINDGHLYLDPRYLLRPYLSGVGAQ